MGYRVTVEIGMRVLAIAIATAPALTGSADADETPPRMVSFYTSGGADSCPEGWQEADYAQGRLIYGASKSGEVGKTVGTPMQDAKAPQHVHEGRVWGEIGKVDGKKINAASGQTLSVTGQKINKVPGVSPGYESFDGTIRTELTDMNIPFIQFLVCESDGGGPADSLPLGAVAAFSGTSCPANGWTSVEQAKGRFLLPLIPTESESSATKPWSVLALPTHSHTVDDMRFVADPDQVVQAGESSSKTVDTYPFLGTETPMGEFTVNEDGKGKTIPFAWTETKSLQVNIPAVALSVCQKQTLSLRKDGVPRGISMFTAEPRCAEGWQPVIGAGGRFIVGIAGNGTQGATFGGDTLTKFGEPIAHTHDGASPVAWGPSEWPLVAESDPAFKGPGFKAVGGFEVMWETEHATVDMPYLMLQFCSKQ